LEEHLEADAYPEIGPSRLDIVTKRFKETARSEMDDGGLESAYTRKN
jgi:hypothetical protein